MINCLSKCQRLTNRPLRLSLGKGYNTDCFVFKTFHQKKLFITNLSNVRNFLLRKANLTDSEQYPKSRYFYVRLPLSDSVASKTIYR